MKIFKTTTLLVCLFTAASAFAAVDKGEWTLSQSDDVSKVRLFLHSEKDGDHSYSSSSDWNAADLKGLDWGTAASMMFTSTSLATPGSSKPKAS